MKDLTPEEISSDVEKVSRIWQEVATHASHMAHARMTLFKAYVAEGFSDAQALELIKQI